MVLLFLTTSATDNNIVRNNYYSPALGHTEHITRGDEILSVNIYLDSTQKWSVGASVGCYDIQTVVLHELGHALGIAHCHEIDDTSTCFSKTCKNNVMNPYMYPNTTKRTFQEYDTASYIMIYD